MAIHYATELDYPLVDAKTKEPVESWDDDYYGLEYVEIIKPDRVDSIGHSFVDPITGEIKIKEEWDNDDLEPMYLLKPYTVEEVRHKQELNEMQAWNTLLNRSPLRLDTVEGTQESADDALCDLYEQLIVAQDTIQTQDDAVCELYEMFLGTEE